MGQYKSTTGQNIYDIVLHIYGSLDWITDLLINNTSLSLSDQIKSGTIFKYTDELIVDSSVVNVLNANSIIPANGSRGVYFKPTNDTPNIILICDHLDKIASLNLSGMGNIMIDWGDNSDIQTVHLGQDTVKLPHIFDSKTAESRKITIYGSTTFYTLDLSGVKATEIYFLQDILVDNYVNNKCESTLEHLRLSKNTLNIDLLNCQVIDLTPIVDCNKLMTLNLYSDSTNTTVFESYLKDLVANYGSRRGCTVIIKPQLSGAYKEPDRDSNSKYVINSAMEAVWVLVNEPEWQEAGFWKIIINNQIYTTGNE